MIDLVVSLGLPASPGTSDPIELLGLAGLARSVGLARSAGLPGSLGPPGLSRLPEPTGVLPPPDLPVLTGLVESVDLSVRGGETEWAGGVGALEWMFPSGRPGSSGVR